MLLLAKALKVLCHKLEFRALHDGISRGPGYLHLCLEHRVFECHAAAIAILKSTFACCHSCFWESPTLLGKRSGRPAWHVRRWQRTA